MVRNIRKFLGLDATAQQLLIEAFISLGSARLLIKTISFKRITSLLEHEPYKTESPTLVDSEEKTAHAIGDAIRIAASHTPWESACLVQVLAAQKMLSKRNISGVFYLGAGRDSNTTDQLHAHAWLKCGNKIITGEAGHERFAVLSTFSWK